MIGQRWLKDFQQSMDWIVAASDRVEIRVVEIGRSRLYAVRGETPLGPIYSADRLTRREMS